MGKKTVMAAVAALFAVIALSAQPNQAPSGKQSSANQSQPPIILSAPEKQDRGADNQTKADPNAPTPHAPFHDPNWMLVIVGIVTCCVIGWQSFETRRSAQAARDGVSHMQRQADLMERQIALLESEQWFEISNWEVQPPHPRQRGLMIGFDITNPGDRPFLMEAEVNVAFTPQEPGFTHKIDPLSLMPQQPYRAGIVILMPPDVCARYESQHTALIIYFTVHGIRRYGDQKRKFMTVRTTLVCRKGTDVTVEHTVRLHPGDAPEEHNENT